MGRSLKYHGLESYVTRSKKGEQVLRFIANYLLAWGFTPTVREIQQTLEISSTSTVSYYLYMLEQNGGVERIPHISRGIRLTTDAKRLMGMVACPTCGHFMRRPAIYSEPHIIKGVMVGA